MKFVPHIEAEIEFLATDIGGGRNQHSEVTAHSFSAVVMIGTQNTSFLM
jgi:hypothetical protein